MVEDDLLSKFKQEIYPNKGIPNKALSKHKLCSTNWAIQTNLPSKINKERTNASWTKGLRVTKIQPSDKKSRLQVLRKSSELTVLMLKAHSQV